MKRLITIAALFCAFTASAQFRTDISSQYEESEVCASMREQIGFLSSAALEGRKAGSEGEKEAAKYVSEQLASYGIDVLSGVEGEIFGTKQASGDTLVSRNVIAYIPGYDKTLKDHYIVIGARLDNLGTSVTLVDGKPQEKIYYGANGNASGLSVLMQLARMLSTNSVLLKRSVIIAAFGSTVGLDAGSWYFLNRSFSGVKDIDAMVDLDMLGTGSRGFYAYTSSNSDLNTMLQDLSLTLQPMQPKVVSQEPVDSNHRMFYDKEIPSVFFTTGMYPEYNTEKDTESIIEYDDMERELEYIYNFTLQLVNGKKPEFRPSEDDQKPRLFGRDVVPYYDCDVRPAFLGSTDPVTFLTKWVYVYLKYPRAAQQNGIQGKVMVDFVIDEKGKVQDVKVVKSVDPLLDEEAVRVIKASPDWRASRVNGKKVKCEMSLYVEFKLEKKK